MKTINIYITGICFLCLAHHASHAQTEQICQNGDFENGSGYPTGQNQLGNCTHWHGTSSVTPDWYTTQNLTGALQGPCSFEDGTDAQIFSATPKVTTYNGSNFYGGFGSHEYMRNTLSRKTYTNSRVKVSFWFSLRGSTYVQGHDEWVSAMLINTQNNNDNIELVRFKVFSNATPLYTTCQWYYFESDWIDTGEPEFDELQIGGPDPNVAGAFNERGYIYIDGVELWNGEHCCPTNMYFEHSSNLPPSTSVINFIMAGREVVSNNITGDVNVLNGQTVDFKAGNEISLLDGFSALPGSHFHAWIEECNPQTEPAGQSITSTQIANVITPNGDGINDEFCCYINGNPQSYDIEIKDRWGITVYQEENVSIGMNPICVWNGTWNTGIASGQVVNNDTYFYVLTFRNCTEETTFNGFIEVLGSPNGRYMNADPANNDIADQQSFSMAVVPNPGSGSMNITYSHLYGNDAEIKILDITGKELYNQLLSTGSGSVTISNGILSEGIYLLRVIQENRIIAFERIVVIR